ncbi:Putative serine protease HhoB precursor [Rosistilla carotiformis]|uniref:Serine protease HhoB n=1 Tax=Rosistilla carotiformis TaxID=2528017 RepID=A0A518JZH8_9BACT|nr:trypsin-like peptidase domain-containing protein [Rosistilla carotiformis]QDV70949.1 Putative serine protease HhoB precursor [Rosistilla carotiformis]
MISRSLVRIQCGLLAFAVSISAYPASAQQKPSGLTFVSAPSALVGVLRGEAPHSLAELRALEHQQQIVSQRVAKCTVSVQIGYAQGSGVVITSDGYVLTAAHVAMRPGQQALMTLSDGRQVHGTTLGMNRHVDAGLIKIDDPVPDEGWPFATLGSSSGVTPGTWCIAVGHPGGYEPDRGAVIRIGRVLVKRETSLVTDCALIGGDSGGPLFDLNGKLIGVHSRIGNDVTDNLHVPIDHYDEHWTRLARGELWGHLPGFRPRIGVQGRKLDERAVIEVVGQGSPAAEAGILPGDVIMTFGEVTIADFESLKSAVAGTMPGEHVQIVLERDGVRKRMILVVGRDPNS